MIVTYRSARLVGQISKTIALFNQFFIVDNSVDPSDSLLSQLKTKFPNGTYIHNARNLGFGAGNNVGLRGVSTEFALIINPDVEIDQQAIQALIDCADRYPNALFVGSQVFDTREGSFFPSYGWGYPDQPNNGYMPPDGDVSTLWLSGCCLLVRVKPFLAMGGFDERFFMYYEEFDICQRAHLAGMECILASQAHVKHESSSSSLPSLRVSFIKDLHWSRSKRIFLDKYGIKKTTTIERALKLVSNSVMAFIALITLNPRRMVKFVARAYSYIV